MPIHQRERVALITAGNPLFAVELVTDWLSREMLREDEGGSWIAEDTPDELPSSLSALWSERIASVITATTRKLGLTKT